MSKCIIGIQRFRFISEIPVKIWKWKVCSCMYQLSKRIISKGLHQIEMKEYPTYCEFVCREGLVLKQRDSNCTYFIVVHCHSCPTPNSLSSIFAFGFTPWSWAIDQWEKALHIASLCLLAYGSPSAIVHVMNTCHVLSHGLGQSYKNYSFSIGNTLTWDAIVHIMTSLFILARTTVCITNEFTGWQPFIKITYKLTIWQTSI